MLSPNFFNTLFVFPILNLLLLFYHGFLMLHIPGAFGFAIITLTVFIRLILHPLFAKQLRTTKKMAEMKPHLDNLQKQHKGDPKKLQSEQMKLYSEAGINPASGCLLLIIQMPVFLGLYNSLNAFIHAQSTKEVVTQMNNAVYAPFLRVQTLDPWFLGINLAVSPSQSHNLLYIVIPVITGILQYFQFKTSLPPPQPKTTDKVLVTKDGEKKSSTAEDFQKAMNTQMKYLFPVMIGYFSYTLPVGLSLYWNIFSLFSIIQYKMMNRQPKAEEVVVVEKKSKKKKKK